MLTSEIQTVLDRAEDDRLSPAARSAILHDLMDRASKRRDIELWRAIAKVLMHAHRKDDLSTQVSDHFVRSCPDEVFRTVARASPSNSFRRWRDRADYLRRKRRH